MSMCVGGGPVYPVRRQERRGSLRGIVARGRVPDGATGTTRIVALLWGRPSWLRCRRVLWRRRARVCTDVPLRTHPRDADAPSCPRGTAPRRHRVPSLRVGLRCTSDADTLDVRRYADILLVDVHRCADVLCMRLCADALGTRRRAGARAPSRRTYRPPRLGLGSCSSLVSSSSRGRLTLAPRLREEQSPPAGPDALLERRRESGARSLRVGGGCEGPGAPGRKAIRPPSMRAAMSMAAASVAGGGCAERTGSCSSSLSPAMKSNCLSSSLRSGT